MLAANHDHTGNMAKVSETGGFGNRAGPKLGVFMTRTDALYKSVEGRTHERRTSRSTTRLSVRARKSSKNKGGGVP